MHTAQATTGLSKMLRDKTNNARQRRNVARKMSSTTHFSFGSCDEVNHKTNSFQPGRGGGITQLSLEFITSHPSLYCKKCSRLLQLLASKMTQGKYLKTTAYFHPPIPPEMQLNQTTNELHRKTQLVSGIYHLPSRLDTSYKSP